MTNNNNVNNHNKSKSVLTTGQVAKICNVAPRTVSKWFDNGQLRGYRIPGSKDRRIPLDQLIQFMKSHGIPTDGLTGSMQTVLVVDHNEQLAGVLCETLAADGDFEVHHALSAFEAGALAEKHHPDVMLVDVSAPDVDAQQLCRALRGSNEFSHIRLIAMSGSLTDGQGEALLQSGFRGYLRKPFDVRQLKELIAGVTV